MNRRVPVAVLREVVAKADEAGLSRRALLGLLGLGGVAAVAGCTTGGSGAARTTAAATPLARARSASLRWANWTLYIDVGADGTSHPTIDVFEGQSGDRVTYREVIEDNASFYTSVKDKLAAGADIGYDLVTLTDWMAAIWVRKGYTRALDHSAMPHVSKLLSQLISVDYDPGRSHSMTWQSGMSGLAWSKQAVPRGLARLDDLWKPEFKGRVEVLSEMRDTIGVIMFSQGVDPSSASWGDNEFHNALDVLATQIASGQIRSVKGNSYKDDLLNGDAVAALGWSGDVAQLNAAHSDAFGFAIPEAGGMLWSDNLMVPSTSTQVVEAQKLIDFYYDPAVAATVAAYVNYITPVVGAQGEMSRIDPSLVDDELIFPSAATLARTAVFRSLTTAEDERYSAAFAQVVGS